MTVTLVQTMLSKREQEVAALFAEALTAREVAERLGLSIHTIRVHKTSIFRKLRINRTVELVNYLNQAGA